MHNSKINAIIFPRYIKYLIKVIKKVEMTAEMTAYKI